MLKQSAAERSHLLHMLQVVCKQLYVDELWAHREQLHCRPHIKDAFLQWKKCCKVISAHVCSATMYCEQEWLLLSL